MVKTYKTNLLNWLKTKFYTKVETEDALALKADLVHNHDTDYSKLGHNHDDLYFTEDEIGVKLLGKSDVGHDHDERYYTETEVDNKLNGKANSIHKHNDLGGLNPWNTTAGGTVRTIIKNGWCLVLFEGLKAGGTDGWYTCVTGLPVNQVGVNVYAGLFNPSITKLRVRVNSDGALQMYNVSSISGSDAVTGSLVYPCVQE